MSSTNKSSPPWRETARYINWLANPFHGLGVANVYDLLADRSATEAGLYLNLGYWQGAETLDEASQALAALVADTAQLGPDDRVLDVGFGFADQDIYWMRAYRPREIIGLNVTASQVERARRRVDELDLAERIDLRLGSATQMPLEAQSVDKVVALESAFHFDTRERFFEEAYRVLRPGGRLVAADIIPMPRARAVAGRLAQRWTWRQASGKFVIPAANAYTRQEYVRKLAHAGFADAQVTSIREQVYPPVHRYLGRHPEAVARLHPMIQLSVRVALKLDPSTVFAGLDYVLASATKSLTSA